MKKLALTTAIVLALSLTTFAQGGSMFHRENSGENGTSLYESRGGFNKDGSGPNLPGHGSNENNDAPLGSGIVMLLGLGAAYAVAKKRREE